MKYFFLILMTAAFVGNAAQILPPMNKQPNKEIGDDAVRGLIAVQPDFTADASCLNYENITGHGFGESLKSAKKADWYRHESKTFIDYFTPGEAAIRYTLKDKKYNVFVGDAENHLWFMNTESPALLALDKSLKFEIVGRETVDFEIAGVIKKREQIKIKVTGETAIGGDWDKTIANLYVAPDLKNLVVKTELILPKGGRICTLRNISFDVPDGLFMDFIKHRQAQIILALPKAEDVAKIEISNTSAINWYEPSELLKLLPEFAASEGTYLSKQPFQRGTFILKNGKKVTWLTGGKDSILLYEGSTEQLFRLPKQVTDKAIFPIWDKDGKEAFIDADGSIVPKSEANNRREFSEGFAPVKIDDKWGYVNEKGVVVINPRWSHLSGYAFAAAGQFHEGLAAVIEGVMRYSEDDLDYNLFKCGYINTKGEYVIAPKFRRSCGNFSDGLARIEVDYKGDEYEAGKGWIGFMNKQGNWAFDRRFFDIGEFHDGFALVRAEPNASVKITETDSPDSTSDPKSFYLIDTNGRGAAGKKDCRWRYDFREGLALTDAENSRKTFVNEQCEEAFRLAPEIKTDAIYSVAQGYDGYGKYADSSYFSENLLLVYKTSGSEKVFGFLDRTGKTAIGFNFADATPFFDGLAGVVIREKAKAITLTSTGKAKSL